MKGRVKMKKNIIYSILTIILGVAVCLIAINPGLLGNDTSKNTPEGFSDEGIEKNPIAGKVIEFKTKDLDDNDIDSSVFKNQEITIINLWGTFCPPCIEEMPEFQKISEDYKGKVRVIGILVDYDKESAKEIIKEKNITYTNIVAYPKLEEQIIKHFDYVPVTLIVNKDGKVLEEFIPGSSNYMGIKGTIDSILNK